MTQTIQPRSWAYTIETENHLNIAKPEAENNMGLLLSVFDSLNTLCEKLSRLNYVIQRKNMEQILYRKGKGEIK
jgi:hypothetical protein